MHVAQMRCAASAFVWCEKTYANPDAHTKLIWKYKSVDKEMGVYDNHKVGEHGGNYTKRSPQTIAYNNTTMIKFGDQTIAKMNYKNIHTKIEDITIDWPEIAKITEKAK